MVNYLSFVASSLFFGTFLLKTSDFLIVESPPLFLGLAGLWLRWWKGSKLIFNVSDLWPESAIELGMVRRNGLAARIACWLEAQCYVHAWLITGQSHGIVKNISERFCGRPVFHLSNGVDTTLFAPEYRTDAARALLGQAGEFVAVYAGLHGHAQGLSQILQAARLLSSDSRIRFVLIGDGPEKARLKATADEMRLTNIRFLDPRPQSEIPAILAGADAILVPLVGQITGAVPSKIYEAMASGRPLIVISKGEPTGIVSKFGVGLSVEPNDTGGLVRALLTLCKDASLAQHFGKNGRNAAIQYFDRKVILERFTKFLTEYQDFAVPGPSFTFAKAEPPRVDG